MWLFVWFVSVSMCVAPYPWACWVSCEVDLLCKIVLCCLMVDVFVKGGECN